MTSGSQERLLRRLVARLASADPDDIEDVLGELGETHRERVRGLLAEFLGEGAAPESVVPPGRVDGARPQQGPADGPSREPAPSLLGLSPWLASRIDPQQGAGAATVDGSVVRPFTLTPATAAALREHARALQPPTKLVEEPSSPTPWTSGLARLLRRREPA